MNQAPADIPQTMQHYLEMWNEVDPALIRSHLDRAVAENCLWVDPQNAHVGRDALEANVRKFRATYPSAELILGSNIDSHHQRYRYEWLILVDGNVLIRGFDVTCFDDQGLIERVDGFFGTLERCGPDV